jgi:carboxymethylenebutenolidase
LLSRPGAQLSADDAAAHADCAHVAANAAHATVRRRRFGRAREGEQVMSAARGRYVTVAAADGKGAFQAYVSPPPRTPAPGIVMQHTMFGVNDQFRSFCDRYAAEGFVVIAPDLFWRIEPGIELDYAEESYEKGHGYIKILDKKKAIEDVEATRRHLLTLPEHRGKVAAVGY